MTRWQPGSLLPLASTTRTRSSGYYQDRQPFGSTSNMRSVIGTAASATARRRGAAMAVQSLAGDTRAHAGAAF